MAGVLESIKAILELLVKLGEYSKNALFVMLAVLVLVFGLIGVMIEDSMPQWLIITAMLVFLVLALFAGITVVLAPKILNAISSETPPDAPSGPPADSPSAGVMQSTAGDNAPALASTGPQSPVVYSQGTVNITYPPDTGDAHKVSNQAMATLVRMLDEKCVELGQREALIQDWIAKYKDLEQKLAERGPNDDFAVKARECLEAGDLQGAEKNLLDSLRSNLAEIEERRLAAAADAFELAKIKQLQLEYQDARKYFEEAVRLSPGNVLYLNELGVLLDDLGEPRRAMGLLEMALEIAKTEHGEAHPNVAVTLNNIGTALHAMGEHSKALTHYENVLKILESSFGNKHPHIAATLNNIGGVLYAMGEHEKAIEHFEKALEMDKATFGDNHPKIATRLNNIGGALYGMGKHKEAIEHFEKALEIDKATFGDNHPDIATDLNNIGGAWDSIGKHKKAIEHYEKALKILESSFGEKHPNIAGALNNIGWSLYSMGEHSKALGYFEKAYNMANELFGKDHPDTMNYAESMRIAKAAIS